MSAHPAWLAVGQRVMTVRRYGARVVLQYEVTVERHTSAGVVADGQRYRRVESRWRVDPEYVLTPRYLSYRETLQPLTDENRGDPMTAQPAPDFSDPHEAEDALYEIDRQGAGLNRPYPDDDYPWPFGEYPPALPPLTDPRWNRLVDAVMRVEPPIPPAIADEIARDQVQEMAEAAWKFIDDEAGMEFGSDEHVQALGRLRDVGARTRGAA